MSRAGMLLCVAGSALSCSLASGRPSDWNAAVSGLWSDAARWNGGIPNSNTAQATVGLPGVYTVTMNVGVLLLGLDVGGTGAVVDIANASFLNYYGTTLHNSGAIRINSTAGGSNTSIVFQDSCTLSGGGEVALNATAGNLDTANLNSISGKVVTNAADHTLRGTGNIHAPLINNGQVLADTPGRVLQLFTTPKINNASIRAQNGGRLVVNGVAINQGAGAILASDGADLSLVNATVSGGGISVTSGAHAVIGGQLTLKGGVQSSGPLDVPSGQALVVAQPDLLHQGRVTVNTTAGGGGTLVRFEQSGSLGGFTEILLNASANLDTAYLQGLGNATLTVPPTASIHGSGSIYLPLVNNGLVHADSGGRVLKLFNAGKVNNGVIRASGGGLLVVNAITLSQGPGGLFTSDQTDLSLISATLSGGSMSVTGGAHAVITGTLVLKDGISTSGPLDIPSGQSLYVSQPNLIHTGTVTVNPTGGGGGTVLRFDQSGTIIGPAEIVLNASANLDTAYIQGLGNATLTVPPTATIRGTGNIYIPLVNNGLIHADHSGSALQLHSTSKTNNAVIKATGGGQIRISDITLTQGSGGVVTSDGADLPLTNVTINGGQLKVTNGATFRVIGSAIFTGGVNYFGPLTIPSGQSLTINQPGTLHAATTVINQSAGGGGTVLRFAQGGTIDGGELLLNASGNLDTAYLLSQAGVTTLGGGETLRGRGRLYGTFINNGTTSVGTSPGVVSQIDCQGTYTMGPDSVLEVDVGGTSSSQFDRVTCSGAVTVGGTIRVRLTGGYVPIGGETFDIVTGASRAGAYTYYDIDQFPGGAKRFAVRYLPGKVQLLARGCTADYDGSGFVDTDDFTDFVLAFEAGTDDADFDGSGFVDTDDFTAYVHAFEAGC